MNLYQLIEKGTNVTLSVSLKDLQDFHSLVIADTKRELEQAVIAEKTETYLTPEKVCEMLGVDRSTLWRWTKRNYLQPVEVGGKRRYKISDIKKILKS